MPSSIRISQRTYFLGAKIDSKTMGRASVGISVQSSAGDVYRVVVTQGRDETRHEVTVTPEDVKRYAPGSTPERLLEASFEFLLEREPASSILPRFALPVIERYFPDYPSVIGEI